MNILEFDHCYGCGVCELICPIHIISMRLNSDGFYSPYIEDVEKCINCELCLKTCAFNTTATKPVTSTNYLYYAAWAKDKEVRNMSSSGGFGYSLLSLLIAKGYKVCVVRYNAKKRRAEHYIATSLKDLRESAGSKYLQSYPTNALKELKSKGKWAVVGTPCQIHSLRKYIRIKHREKDFVLLDFFCHGVPSYHLFNKYLEEIEEKNGKSTNVQWRIKKGYGWHDSWVMRVTCKNGIYEQAFSKGDLFYQFFLKNRCLNTSCYIDCKYKMIDSYSDIRMGDLWGSKFATNEKGVSGVVVFSEKGKIILNDSQVVCSFSQESPAVVLESQMKTCATKSVSYKFIKKYLSNNKLSLYKINKVASSKEFICNIVPRIKYYVHRFPIKILELCRLK